MNHSYLLCPLLPIQYVCTYAKSTLESICISVFKQFSYMFTLLMLLYISIYCICISLLSNSAATSNMCFCLHTVFICISIFQQCGCREPKVLAVITPSSYHPPSHSAMTTFYLGANKHLNPSVCLNFPTVRLQRTKSIGSDHSFLLSSPLSISNDDILPRCQ